MSSTSAAVQHAEHLLRLAKSLADPPAAAAAAAADASAVEPKPDTLAAWNTKLEIQRVCDQLLESTMGPLQYTVVLAESCHESQALHFVTVLGIPDMIGDGEASLATLSTQAGVLPQFVAVTMSCLLGRGYFEEVGHFGSRVYKNNTLSQILREAHPTSLKAAVGFIGDEGFRASSRLVDAAKVPAPGAKKSLPAGNLAFGFEETVFEWMARPEQAWRAERLGRAMQQLDKAANVHAAEDYPWERLASPVIDVGGGIGSLEMSLVAHARLDHLQFIIFDLPNTIKVGQEIWNARLPDRVDRVSFVPGSFMARTLAESNIPQGKPTYVIRHVLHDWTDDEVVLILGRLREAMLTGAGGGAARGARLVVVEMLLRPASPRFLRSTSMQLLGLNNGATRTQGEMEDLVRRAGFRVERVVYMRALDSVIEAEPAVVEQA